MINLNNAIDLLKNGMAQFKESDDNCMTEGELVILLEELQRYKDLENEGLLLKLPCKIGDYVNSKNGNWCGEVGEITYNSDGLSLYVIGGYNHYVRSDEVIYRENNYGK